MNLREIMNEKTFAVVGNTIVPEKFAYKIKHRLIENGYNVHCVGKELESLNDIEEDIDIVNLCIHPAKGIKLLKEMKKDYKCVLIQPGAESDEIIEFLKENNIDYLEDCVLIGLEEYID